MRGKYDLSARRVWLKVSGELSTAYMICAPSHSTSGLLSYEDTVYITQMCKSVPLKDISNPVD